MAGIYTSIAKKRVEQNKETTPSPSPSHSQAPASTHTLSSTKKEQISGKPEIMKSRNHEGSHLRANSNFKPKKYSTLLNPNLIKKLKLHAAEMDVKDYELLEIALTHYFDKHN